MMDVILFKEITPQYEGTVRWNNVSINAGASQSTLQDIKLPEGAGYFTYNGSGDFMSTCSNRFIYWRTNHDVIELAEISLDYGLLGNHLRLRFVNTPILPGVSVHETREHVILLVATISAIHKITFSHPFLFDRDNSLKSKSQIMPSIFYDTSNVTLKERSCYFVLNHVSLGMPLPHTACTWLNIDDSASFVLANNVGSLMLITMSNKHKNVDIVTTELMKTGSLFRLLNGLVPLSMKNSHSDVALSIVCHQHSSDVLVISLFGDLQIRIWSQKRHEIILTTSLLNFDAEKHLVSGKFTAHQCCLRKSHNYIVEFYLAVYIPMPLKKSFYIFKFLQGPDGYKLELISILNQMHHVLVDFSLSLTHLWTLWLTSENQPLVLTAALESNLKNEPQICWTSIDLEPRVSRTIDKEMRNPRDIYMKEIFKMGRFLPSTIAKALSIYHSSKDCNLSSDMQIETECLKMQVVKAIESHILEKIGSAEDSEKEYLQASLECWDLFFSYCIQYHEVSMKPVGLSLDPNTGWAIIVKKNFYSLLGPYDPMQQLIQANLNYGLNVENLRLYYGLKAIISCIEVLRQYIDENVFLNFDEKLYQHFSPMKYASDICNGIDLQPKSDILQVFQSRLPSNDDLLYILNYLILKLDLTSEEKNETDHSLQKFFQFSSSLSGTSLLCTGIINFTKQRYVFCRDLLILEILLSRTNIVENDYLENLFIESNIIQKTISLVRSYYAILWITQFECKTVSSAIQEAACKQFYVLELLEYTNIDFTLLKSGRSISNIFFQAQGGLEIRKLMELRTLSLDLPHNWVILFPFLIESCVALLWPLDGNFLFAEFLFSHCQYQALQEYNRMLMDWCAWNKQSRIFLVAASYLIIGEPQKALKMFLDVAKELESDFFLYNRLIKSRYDLDSSRVSLFYMRVIQIFEQFSLSECIIELASSGIEEIKEDDTHIPIFYSLLFKHQLSLGLSEDAFRTLIKNPDPSRKKDCLRQLIVKLCETQQFQKIVEISYLAFENEVVSILESRARCSDLHNNASYYGILYALNIHHKKYRKAAAVMYELGMRYGREVVNLDGLEKQASCYLAAINCLQMAEPEYAWIVKPCASGKITDDPENITSNSPKRNADGEEIKITCRFQKVEVLGLKDMYKEYDLVRARLCHACECQYPPNLTATPLTPYETVTLLLNSCLFETALQLSKSFSLSLIPIFEALAYKCLNSIMYSNFEEKDSNTNLQQNSSLLNVTNKYINSRYHVWYLLKFYLIQYENDGQSDLHKCVAEKLLANGIELPAWLKLSYQKRNMTELLNLYVSYGFLEEAVNLIIKYINAVLGKTKDDFSIKYALHSNTPAIWIPHTYIDILIDALNELKNSNFDELSKQLQIILDFYNKAVISASHDKLLN